jgi:hypothetical protein
VVLYAYILAVQRYGIFCQQKYCKKFWVLKSDFCNLACTTLKLTLFRFYQICIVIENCLINAMVHGLENFIVTQLIKKCIDFIDPKFHYHIQNIILNRLNLVNTLLL